MLHFLFFDKNLEGTIQYFDIGKFILVGKYFGPRCFKIMVHCENSIRSPKDKNKRIKCSFTLSRSEGLAEQQKSYGKRTCSWKAHGGC